jgi:ATP citrate (pro-S)-lyase
VGDVDAKARRLEVPVDSLLTDEGISAALLRGDADGRGAVPAARMPRLAAFIRALHECYVALHFCYLEINPLVVTDTFIAPLDLAAKLDECARFECASAWAAAASSAASGGSAVGSASASASTAGSSHALEFPAPFGRPLSKEENYIAALDAKTGASLKLTILNADARIWTMVAGGGASVIYADTVSDLGGFDELANYGEYSGDPTEALTFEYAQTLLSLLLRSRAPPALGPKILIVGGGAF